MRWAYAANLVLQDTIERIYVGNCYGDIPRGIFLIRGENVVLLGEIVRRNDEISMLERNRLMLIDV